MTRAVCEKCGGPLTDLCTSIENYFSEMDLLTSEQYEDLNRYIEKDIEMTNAVLETPVPVATKQKRTASTRRAMLGKVGSEMVIGSVIVLDERGLLNGDRINFRSTLEVERIEPTRDRQYFVVNGKYRYDRAGFAYFAV